MRFLLKSPVHGINRTSPSFLFQFSLSQICQHRLDNIYSFTRVNGLCVHLCHNFIFCKNPISSIYNFHFLPALSSNFLPLKFWFVWAPWHTCGLAPQKRQFPHGRRMTKSRMVIYIKVNKCPPNLHYQLNYTLQSHIKLFSFWRWPAPFQVFHRFCPEVWKLGNRKKGKNRETW